MVIKRIEDRDYGSIGLDRIHLLEISILQSLRGCDNLLQLLNLELRFDARLNIAMVDLMTPNHTSDLTQFIKTVPFTERLKYADQVIDQLLNGLFQMYHRGILHRDIKPDNIFLDYDYDPTKQMLTESPHCYYGDFGLAKQLACNVKDRHEPLRTWVYTVMYRPPELMVGRDDYTDKADLWALGVTLVEYLSREWLFLHRVDDSDAIKIVLPKLSNPPPINQYAQYIDQLKQGTIHAHVFVVQFLVDTIGVEQTKLIPMNIITMLNQLLQVNPNDRPSITTLVTNQVVCPDPPTLLSRGALFQNTGMTVSRYYKLVDWLTKVAKNEQLRQKTFIVCIDMFDRYLAHYHVIPDDSQLIILTLLLIAISMIQTEYVLTISDLVDYSKNKYTADQFETKELDIIRQLNYTFLSCEIDPYVSYIEQLPEQQSVKYDRLSQLYKKIESKGLYAGDLSYDQIMSYLD